MRGIKKKERELSLLARVPVEEFVNYERLRKDHSATILQRAWKRKANTGDRHTSMNSNSSSNNTNSSGMKEPLLTRERSESTSSLLSASSERERTESPTRRRTRVLMDQITALRDRSKSSNSSSNGQYRDNSPQPSPLSEQDQASQNPSSRGRSIAVELPFSALGLAQLQRRIKDSAAAKQRAAQTRGIVGNNMGGTINSNKDFNHKDFSSKLAQETFSNTMGNRNQTMSMFNGGLYMGRDGQNQNRDPKRERNAGDKYRELSDTRQKADSLLAEYLSTKNVRDQQTHQRLCT